MAEYIKREALITEFKRLKLGENGLIERIFADGVYAVLETFQSEDVAPVRYGSWIEHKHFNHDHYIDSTYECSECNVEEPLTSDYCPNCGAKMDGGAD